MDLIDISGQELSFLNEENLNEIIEVCRTSENWSSLIKAIGSVFSNPDFLMRSFQMKCSDKGSKETNRRRI